MIRLTLLLLIFLYINSLHCQQGKQYSFTLKNQAFPSSGKPGALVYFPTKFNKDNPLNIVVYIHGWHNCISNCILDVGKGVNCTPSGAKRISYGLIKQIESADPTSLLLLPEVQYDQPSSDPGLLGKNNGFLNFMNDLFDQLTPIIGKKSLSDVNHIMVFSHSGGYVALSAIATIGGVPQVREIILLDSLYGNFDRYDQFVKQNLAKFGDGSAKYRLGNIYTDNGGTYANSVAEASRISKMIEASNVSKSIFLYDNTYGTLTPDDFKKHPIIVKRSSLAHDGVPTYYISRFITAFMS